MTSGNSKNDDDHDVDHDCLFQQNLGVFVCGKRFVWPGWPVTFMVVYKSSQRVCAEVLARSRGQDKRAKLGGCLCMNGELETKSGYWLECGMGACNVMLMPGAFR